MRRLGPIRFISLGVATAALVGMSLATPAGAAGGAVCTKASSTTTKAGQATTTSSLSGCNNAAATGGKGSLLANYKNLAKITVKITWNKTGTSTLVLHEKVGPKTNKCHGSGATKDGLILTTGTVTGGTGKAGTLLKNTKFSESLCVHTGGTKAKPTYTSYLLPGSKVLI